MKQLLYTTSLLSLGLALPALADIVHSDTVIIKEDLCVGANSCEDGEVFAEQEDIKIKSSVPGILFDNTPGTGDDWIIETDNPAHPESFAVRNVTTGNFGLVIEDGVDNNSMYMDGGGDLGLGTTVPAEELHIAGTSSPGIRLEDTGGSPGAWDIEGTSSSFVVRDVTNNTLPFRVEDLAPNYSLNVEGNGYVGLGTSVPDGKLHTVGDGHQIVYFESADSNAVQVRFRTDSQNRRFLATNNADQVQSQLIFLNSQVRIAGPTDSGGDLYAIFGPAGLVTRGPVCNPGPCDKVFDPAEFEVPTIEDHAAYMWENQHLWAVGPTSPDEPFNLTQKAGGMLHELEVAHIYIEELHTRLETQEADKASLLSKVATQDARLAALEAALETLSAN